eukprot:COSAG01_NODE_10808_length_2075_cov_25.719871_1_plen_28_part_10
MIHYYALRVQHLQLSDGNAVSLEIFTNY